MSAAEMRTPWLELPAAVRDAAMALQTAIAREMPSARGVQVTYNRVHTEEPPTFDILRNPRRLHLA